MIIALDTDFDFDKKTAFVGTGNQEAARGDGQAAAERAIEQGVENPTAVIIVDMHGDEMYDARLKGHTHGFEAAGGKVIDVQYCEGLADCASDNMEAVIKKYPEGVNVLFSTNDDMAMEVVKRITDSDHAVYENTIVCGFDGNQSAIEAVQDSSLALDIAQNGYDMGYKAVEAAFAALDGETVESFVGSSSTVVDSTRVEAYIQGTLE